MSAAALGRPKQGMTPSGGREPHAVAMTVDKRGGMLL